jgi:hypothetical protein
VESRVERVNVDVEVDVDVEKERRTRLDQGGVKMRYLKIAWPMRQGGGTFVLVQR